jgi:hypothetical protein
MKYTIRHDKRDGKGTMRGDGKLALGVVIGVMCTLLIYLLFEFGTGATEVSAKAAFIPVLISLLVGMASILLAGHALLEQKKAREAGTDPVLVAHLGQRDDARELVTFNISNIGAGAAMNVHLWVESPDGNLEGRDLVTNVFREHRPFTVILQGKSIEFSLAMGWNLLGDQPLPPFQAKLTYEDLAGGKYESEFTIDVREMEGLGSHKSPQMRMVAALEKIAGSIS